MVGRKMVDTLELYMRLLERGYQEQANPELESLVRVQEWLRTEKQLHVLVIPFGMQEPYQPLAVLYTYFITREFFLTPLEITPDASLFEDYGEALYYGLLDAVAWAV